VQADKNTQVSIHAAAGSYIGKYLKRVYLLNIHQAAAPKSVAINDKPLIVYTSAYLFNKAITGCYFDPDKKGILRIKTAYLETNMEQSIKILN